MKKNCAASVILILWFMPIFSQVPGYLGKRTTFVFSVAAHPAIGEMNSVFATGNPNEDISLNATYAIEYNYLVKPKGAFCLTFNYSHLGLNFEDNYSNTYSYSGSKAFPAYQNLKGLSLGYKFFSRNKIAPLGTYLKLEGIFVYNTLKYYTDGAYEMAQESYFDGWGTSYRYVKKPLNLKDGKVDSFGGGLSMALGRQRIFNDILVLDFGVRFAMVLAPDGYSNSGYVNEFHTFSRTFFNQFINFRLGIGFLAF